MQARSVAIRLTPEQDDYLQTLARRYRVSVGEIVRRLIEQERDIEISLDADRSISSYSRFDRRPRRRPQMMTRDNLDLDLDHLEPDLDEASPSSEPETPVFRRSEQR